MSETIQRTKLYEDVTERMLDHIRTETWAPGHEDPAGGRAGKAL